MNAYLTTKLPPLRTARRRPGAVLMLLLAVLCGVGAEAGGAEAMPKGFSLVDLTPFALGTEEPAARSFSSLP